MGVLNITPNSFSDGGEFLDLDKLSDQYHKLIQGCDIIDVGAESTAPFNNPIDECEELSRFERYFIPFYRKLDSPPKQLSVDSYHPNVFKEIYSKIRVIHPDQNIIWNDVSGALDKSALALLTELADVDYVLSHTEAPERSETSNHMDYLSKARGMELVELLANFFSSSIEKLTQEGISAQRVILDPCFGFSKSREQNHDLINGLPNLIEKFSSEQRWLCGISRKSFLRLLDLPRNDPKLICQTEILQSILLTRWQKRLPEKTDLTVRIHNENLPKMLMADLFGQEY